MRYETNGKRIKTENPGWIHNQTGIRENLDLDHHEFRTVPFGQHLLKKYPQATINVVESEKTAAVLSQISHGWVWLASGGSNGLKNADKNKALEGREVWLLPDHGQYWSWAMIAKENGWEIFDTIEKNPVFPGCDVLDLLEAGALGSDLLKYCKL
jgi:hypothetical protein